MIESDSIFEIFEEAASRSERVTFCNWKRGGGYKKQ
jgi:hypothetical protein